MSFFHSGPFGRVAIEPKTSESEGVLRLCRHPVSACPGEEDDRRSGTDETAMLRILRHLHNLVANNLQLHSAPWLAPPGCWDKYRRGERLWEGDGWPARRLERRRGDAR